MILYLDTETTGLRPGQICQLSYLMQSSGGVSAKNFFFSVESVDFGALAVHGFTPEKLKILSNGKVFASDIEEIESDFTSADCVVAHNIAFDTAFLRKEFENVGKILIFNDEFCSMKNSVTVCKLSRKSSLGYKYPKLSELCEFFDITEEDIINLSKSVFGCSFNYHDARFDVCALYLAVNKGIFDFEQFEKLRKYL